MDLIVLCGGKGARLKPLTDEIPKALVELDGKPMIDHIIDAYSTKGISNYFVCIGYKGGLIRNHLKDKQNISFVDSGEEASMLERICDAVKQTNETAIVTYGDTITNIDFIDLMRHHTKSGSLATLVTAHIKSPFGIINYNIENGVINGFEEKPVFNYYIGTFVLAKKAFSYADKELLQIPDGGGLVAFFRKLIEIGKVSAYHYGGEQLTFNNPAEKQLAEARIGFYTLGDGNGK